ncbi:hypothetical protein [Pseudarthrobacter sp. 1C304]|uniref:hypothetical protein n=1 Tax=Pseudarthrobacter sp. 1C304 TaxID=3457438 RepID=UPI003FD3134C
MTGTRDPQQDGSIHAMLRDSGLETSTELRSSLEELRALVPDRAPVPRADLAALLSGGQGAGAAREASTTMMPAVAADTTAMPAVSAVDQPAGVVSLTERRGRKRRLAIVGGAVIGAMTLGVGAVAASSEDFRDSVSKTVGIIWQPVDEAPDVAPEPARPSPTDLPAAPAPAKVPGGATPPAAGVVPKAPGSAGAVPATPGAATPPAVGRDGVLPDPPRRPVSPGVPGLPAPGKDRGAPSDPKPEPTLPAVLPTLPSN